MVYLLVRQQERHTEYSAEDVYVQPGNCEEAMKKRGSIWRSITLPLLVLVASRGIVAGALPRQSDQDFTNSISLFQTLAIADFDGDNRLDKATLGGAGCNKSIEIRLSQTRARSVLHFDTRTSDHGSLFVQDVDHDGDNDLIWTDLIHPDDVVVWLDDGTGRFERVRSAQYSSDFVLTGAPGVDSQEIPQQDFAFSPWNDPSPASLPDQTICQPV